MQELKVIEKNNQRVLTTKQLSKKYKVNSKKIRDNFTNNKNKYVEGLHYFKLEGEELKKFKNDNENFGVVGNKTSSIYLWTERGALYHAKSLNTVEAWNVYDALVDNYFTVKALSIEDMMIAQLKEQKLLKQRVSTVEDKLDNQMTIDSGQQRKIQKEIAKRVNDRFKFNKYYTSVFELNELKSVDIKAAFHIEAKNNKRKRKYFSSIHREIKNRFAVPSYRDIKIKDFDLVINYISNWVENQELRED